MTWGTFGLTHFITLAAAPLLIIGLYFILKNLSPRAQTVILGVLSFSGIAAILYNLIAWNSPLEYLPFHLCSLNALILPVAVLTKNKALGNLLLLWSLGALFALVVNYGMAECELFSLTFAFYYFPHVLEFGIPLLLLKLKRLELSSRYIPSTIMITMAVYTVIHFINVALNAYCLENGILNPSGNLVQVNYMFSIVPENPLLALFYSLIPYPYWYMYLAVPVIALYLALLCNVKRLFHKKV